MGNILVVGGAGYVGAHVNKMLAQAGYRTVVLDNLSRGMRQAVIRGLFVQGDMGDRALLENLFSSHSFDAVMLFAAFIDVGESVSHPDLYYENNVCKVLCLLQTMLRHGVKRLIFSSTAAVYGLPQQKKISEEHPMLPINPYGESKLMVEKILRDLDKAYGFRFCSLRYFNAAGGDPEGEIKNLKESESNLIPLALRSLLKPGGQIKIFGTDYPTKDGSCIRDYIHVCDLGTAHLAALEQLLEGAPSSCYNLGNGEGFTVFEVLQAIEKVTQLKLSRVASSRRPGDPPILIADSHKAKELLHWKPLYPDLDAIVSHAWKALSSNAAESL